MITDISHWLNIILNNILDNTSSYVVIVSFISVICLFGLGLAQKIYLQKKKIDINKFKELLANKTITTYNCMFLSPSISNDLIILDKWKEKGSPDLYIKPSYYEYYDDYYKIIDSYDDCYGFIKKENALKIMQGDDKNKHLLGKILITLSMWGFVIGVMLLILFVVVYMLSYI